jgi:hypothetical protein
VLLALASFGLVTALLRRRAMGPPARPLGGLLVLAAFCSLFVGVLLDQPPRWLPYVAWGVAGAGAALLRHASGWRDVTGLTTKH